MKKLYISWFLKRTKAIFLFVITAFSIVTLYYYWVSKGKVLKYDEVYEDQLGGQPGRSIRFNMAKVIINPCPKKTWNGIFRPIIPMVVIFQVIQSYSQLPTSSRITVALPQPTASANLHGDYWVIVDSNNYRLCRKLSGIFRHWVILFVSYETMNRQASSSCRSLPKSAVPSVFFAFKYAIEQGAKAVFIADLASDLDTFSRVSQYPDNAASWGLTHTSNASFFESQEYFGCSSKTLAATRLYSVCRRNSAIFVPAAVTSQGPLAASVCDQAAPDLTMGRGSYVDIFPTGSLFMQSGFWLFHSFSRTEYSFVWSCIAQWLLWQTENRLTVYWSRVDIVPPYGRSGKIRDIFNVLDTLKCDGDFIRCVYNVSQHMIDAQLVSRGFISMLQEWFVVLTSSGYSFPRFSSERPCTDYVNYHSLDFSSSFGSRRVPVTNLLESLSLYDKTCSSSLEFDDNSVRVALSKPWKQFMNMMLVITFNEPHYEVIPYLEMLYRSIFPRIVYCGPHMDFSRHENLKRYRFSFITYSVASVGNVSGALNYECAIKVSRINFNVDGYLFLSDDLLLFPSLLAKLRDDRIWFIPQSEIRVGDLNTLRECNLGMCDFQTNWKWWEDYRDATINALNVMHSKCGISPLICDCISKLKQLNGDLLRVNGGYSDIFYIPRQLMQDFASLADVFLSSGVFLEIAVPTVLRCLRLPEDVQELPGKQIWDSTRVEPWKYFRRTVLFGKMYLHPVKWSNLTTLSEEHVSFYCNSVLPHLYNPFSVLPD